MKKFLLSIMLMVVLFPLTMKADEIITGEGTGDSNLGPFVNSYPHSWIEMIYQANEIGQACKIGNIAFQYAEGSACTATDIRIYLAETTKSKFADKTQWTPESELTLVYSGTDVVLGDTDWESFELDTPFEYGGENNLVVVIAKSSNQEMSLRWSCYNAANSILFTASDYDAVYAQYPTGEGLALYSKKPVMKLTTVEIPDEPVLPAAPANLSAIVEQDIEGYDYKYRITMSWDAVEGIDVYNVYVNTANATDYLMGFTNGTSYVAGTNNEGTIEFYVRTVKDELESEPSEVYTIVIEDDAIEEFASSFNIYPNPANDKLFIEAETNVEEVSVYTLTGVMVYNEQCSMNNVQLNVSDLNSGVYFVKVRTYNGETVKRFIKK